MLGRSSPHPAPPFNPHTDFDVLVELPAEVQWFRFETLVGFADWATESWVLGAHAKFIVIDEDTQVVCWESSEMLEPWAPTEFCSFLLLGANENDGEGVGASLPPFPLAPRRLCLRVSCPVPPDGALWIDPVVTALRGPPRRWIGGSSSCSPWPGAASALDDFGGVDCEFIGVGEQLGRPWVEVILGELVVEVAVHLTCRDLARLLRTCFVEGATQQLLWHFVFAYCFPPAYVRHFLRPLQGQPRPAALPRQSAASAKASSGRLCLAPRQQLPASGTGLRHATTGFPPASMGARSTPQPPSIGSSFGVGSRGGAGGGAVNSVLGCASEGLSAGLFAPAWALETFDWQQICRRFYLAQLLCVSVNFQMVNCMTPAGFLKDSGETMRAPAKACLAHAPHQGGQGSTAALRCGWNIPLGAENFLSRPSAVVAHRSPLGVAGMPRNVATVRGTAGPEPLAMTPMVSEKDSSVVLPQLPPLGQHNQVRPQWTLEVDPGRYLVVATVGDRNVGFSASLEVGGQPLFGGEWIEAGTFKSKSLLCFALRGAITVGPYWPPCSGSEDGLMLPPASDVAGAGSPGGSEAVRHESPRSHSPPRAHSPTGAGIASPPRSSKVDTLARGTRLVSLRVVSAPLAREVAHERHWALAELTNKMVETQTRTEELLETRSRLLNQPCQVGEPSLAADGRSAATSGSIDRELSRAHGKHAELQVQKALKLCSMIAMSKRVTHPYIYLNGEASSTPPTSQALHAPNLEVERPTPV